MRGNIWSVKKMRGPVKKMRGPVEFLGARNMDLGPGKKIEIPLCPFSTLTTEYSATSISAYAYCDDSFEN